jgi:hypothetical protein
LGAPGVKEKVMAIATRFGQQLMSEYGGKPIKLKVVLLDGAQTELTGTLFTAQDDYLQIDEEGGRHSGRLTVPFSAVALIIPSK